MRRNGITRHLNGDRSSFVVIVSDRVIFSAVEGMRADKYRHVLKRGRKHPADSFARSSDTRKWPALNRANIFSNLGKERSLQIT